MKLRRRFITPGVINTHTHLRCLREVVRDAILYALLGGSEVLLTMPNLEKWLKNAPLVLAYLSLCKSLIPKGRRMRFIPTAVITETTSLRTIDELARKGIKDVKVYPKDRTTNSKEGVRDYWKLLRLVKRCGELGIRVHFHPEHPWMEFDNRVAEFMFLPIVDMFIRATNAIIIWEHGTDARCIPFWKEWAKTGRFYVTLTAHHLATDENATFGDVRATCKPPIKTPRDRSDLVKLVMEDHDWVMAGADDAPHPIEKKHTAHGKCACGAYTAPFLLSLYAHALDALLQMRGGVRIFKRFIHGNAAKLYKIRIPTMRYVLERKPQTIPDSYKLGPWTVLAFWARQELLWTHSLLGR